MARASILLVLWLALLGSAPNAKQNERAEQPGSANEVQNGEAPSQSDVVAASPEVETVEPVQTQDCEPGQDNRKSDLCAQWKAADAAREAANWARWSFFLAIAGTLGLFATLYYTRKAVRAAEDATADADAALAVAERNARAAADHVAVARQSAESELRAYLSISDAFAFGMTPERQPTFCVTIKNQGRTPAHKVRIFSVVTWTASAPEDVVVRFTDPAVKVGTLAGGMEWTYKSETAGHPWPPGLYAAVMSMQCVLVYSGVVAYRDIFRKRRLTTFKAYLRIDDVVNDKAGLALAKGGNHAN
jgi:hypothetical protein